MSKTKQTGYTLIELIIAFALITAALATAMVAINSRLKSENFYKGVSRFESIWNDLVNDVATNNFPHVDGSTCELKTTIYSGIPAFEYPTHIEFKNNVGHQTGEGDCIYAGKVVQFGASGNMNDPANDYVVHTLIAHRDWLVPEFRFDRPQPFTTLYQPSRNSPPFTGFDYRESELWPLGIHVEQVYYIPTLNLKNSGCYHGIRDTTNQHCATDPTNSDDRIHIRGVAIVLSQAGGLGNSDVDYDQPLHQLSGASHVGLRLVIPQSTANTLNGSNTPDDPSANPRPNSNLFAHTLDRIGKVVGGSKLSWVKRNGWQSHIVENGDFKLPVYVCLSDGRGRSALALLSPGVTIDFDPDTIQTYCG